MVPWESFKPFFIVFSGIVFSGQQILGPKKTKNPEKIIKDLFEKARE